VTVAQTISKVVATLAAAGVTYLGTRGWANPQVQGALLLLCPIIGDQVVDHIVPYLK
jgi:hypothetical protein